MTWPHLVKASSTVRAGIAVSFNKPESCTFEARVAGESVPRSSAERFATKPSRFLHNTAFRAMFSSPAVSRRRSFRRTVQGAASREAVAEPVFLGRGGAQPLRDEYKLSGLISDPSRPARAGLCGARVGGTPCANAATIAGPRACHPLRCPNCTVTRSHEYRYR